ncbi:MAG: helix-turn-helix transcriptional regulator, partial [Solirubrobacterales bacterium]|nr:helix-turn-helix transcriptional regulator [Solirubrobacterales bacterium]
MPKATAASAAARQPLTRARVLDAATELVERDGPGALSMRGLGRALGVEGMAIYHHFKGREDLTRALAVRLLEPLNDLAPSSDWRAASADFATCLRAIAVTRPATFQLVGMHPLAEASLPPVERLLGCLVGA